MNVENPQNSGQTPASKKNAAGPNKGSKSKPMSGTRILLIASISVSLILLIGAGYLYFRTTSFINATTGGRNVGSLLTTTTKVAVKSPTQAPANAATAAVTTAIAANQTISVPPTSSTTIAPTATPTPQVNLSAIARKIVAGDSFNIMVLGYGGVGHDGAFLTDTILIIHYDPAKKAVVMTNIPRDLFVFVPYGGAKIGFWGKINSAFSYVMESSSPSDAGLSSRYAYGAGYDKQDAAANLTKDVIEQVTGVPIDYWATFNFNGFRKLVDAVGGVDVTVDTAFDDYDYPANDNADVDASVMHIHFDAGPQHMNGERAIEFARSRKSAQDGSDFARSKRQMKLIQALKDKITQPSVLLKAFDIMDALQDNVRTSFTFDELHGLFDYYRGPDGKEATSNMLFVSQILSTNLLYDQPTNGYILLPIAGQGNYKDIQLWIQQGFDNPEVRSENARLQIHNASGTNKAATNLQSTLEDAGFQDVGVDWATSQLHTIITDYTNGKDKNSLKALQNLFPNASVTTSLKPSQTAPDIAVTLGQDYNQTTTSSSSTGSNINQSGWVLGR